MTGSFSLESDCGLYGLNFSTDSNSFSLFFKLLGKPFSIIIIIWGFFTPAFANGSPQRVEWPQVSRTLLSTLADLNNAVVWIVSTCPLISKSSSSSMNPLVTVLSTPITIGITINFMFNSFFLSLERSRYLSLFCLPTVLPCSQLECQSPLFSRFSFFFVDHPKV